MSFLLLMLSYKKLLHTIWNGNWFNVVCLYSQKFQKCMRMFLIWFCRVFYYCLFKLVSCWGGKKSCCSLSQNYECLNHPILKCMCFVIESNQPGCYCYKFGKNVFFPKFAFQEYVFSVISFKKILELKTDTLCYISD